jgi:hypothetical protein
MISMAHFTAPDSLQATEPHERGNPSARNQMSTVTVTRWAAVSRWVRHSVPCLLAALAFVPCAGNAADDSDKARQRDGAWLQNGINEYERLNAHQGLLSNDTNDALVVRSYVCAIIDLEEYMVVRAELLARAVGEARKQHHINPERFRGMAEALPILVPLMQTKFSTESPPCDRIVLIVRDYLGKYPEMLSRDADVIIEKALLDVYSKMDEP